MDFVLVVLSLARWRSPIEACLADGREWEGHGLSIVANRACVVAVQNAIKVYFMRFLSCVCSFVQWSGSCEMRLRLRCCLPIYFTEVVAALID